MDKILRTIYVQLFIFTCLKLHYCMTESASRRDEPILTARDFQRWSRKETFSFLSYNKSFKSFFLGVFMDWDEKNLTNFQPSWPHAWSKTYIYYMAKSAIKSFFLGVFMDWDEKNLTNFQPSWPHAWSKTYIYYMAKSARGQDEVTPTFWLATRAGKMGPSCPRGISRVGPTSRKKTFSLWPYNKSLIDQACSVKIAGYPVILTSRLVNGDN